MGWRICCWWEQKPLPKVDAADKQAWLEANRILSRAGDVATQAYVLDPTGEARALRQFMYDAANYAGHMYGWACRA